MDDIALMAIDAAARAIKAIDGIKDCTVESDADSTEILFSVNGNWYTLRLQSDN